MTFQIVFDPFVFSELLFLIILVMYFIALKRRQLKKEGKL